MREEQHEAIARWERRWLAMAGVLLVTFVIFIAFSLTLEGRHIAQQSATTTPEDLAQFEVFAQPGAVRTGPGQFRVGMVGQSFAFTPARLQLPVGAETTFYLTSRDVLHGFQVENTNINVELIPGEISTFSYTFDEIGEYRISCNEYCGIGHQNMIGSIEVVDERTFARLKEAEAARAGASPGEASLALGEEVYSTNCAGCHQANGQGSPGVFPPLAGHATDLYAADGGREYLVNVLLYGLQGRIAAEGETYNGQMPAWSQLSNEQIAGVLNYILNTWANETAGEADGLPYAADDIEPFRQEVLTPDQVHEIRESLPLGG